MLRTICIVRLLIRLLTGNPTCDSQLCPSYLALSFCISAYFLWGFLLKDLIISDWLCDARAKRKKRKKKWAHAERTWLRSAFFSLPVLMHYSGSIVPFVRNNKTFGYFTVVVTNLLSPSEKRKKKKKKRIKGREWKKGKWNSRKKRGTENKNQLEKKSLARDVQRRWDAWSVWILLALYWHEFRDRLIFPVSFLSVNEVVDILRPEIYEYLEF